MSKKIDPIHFFDSRGQSLLTIEHLIAQIEEKDARIERLEELIRYQNARKAKPEDEFAN